MATAFEPAGLFRPCEEPGYIACHVASWLWKIVPFTMLLAGTCCNILTLLVLSRPVLKKFSTTMYLVFLALSDLGFLWPSLLERSLLFNFEIDIRVLSFFTCSVLHWIKFTAGSISMWILVLLTFERVLFISYPVFAKRKMTRKFATVACCTLLALIALTNIHLTFGLDIIGNNFPENVTAVGTNQTGYIVSKVMNNTNTSINAVLKDKVVAEVVCADRSGWYKHFRLVFWIRFAAIVHVYIPLALMISGNSYIAVSLWNQRRRVVPFLSREQLQNNMRMRAAKLLFVLCGFHMVCTTPFATFHYAYTMVDNSLTDRQFANVQLMYCIVMLLLWSNFSFNFMLYIYSGTIFNRECKKLFHHYRDTLKACVSRAPPVKTEEGDIELVTVTKVDIISDVTTPGALDSQVGISRGRSDTRLGSSSTIWPASREKGPSDITNSLDPDQPTYDVESTYM